MPEKARVGPSEAVPAAYRVEGAWSWRFGDRSVFCKLNGYDLTTIEHLVACLADAQSWQAPAAPEGSELERKRNSMMVPRDDHDGCFPQSHEAAQRLAWIDTELRKLAANSLTRRRQIRASSQGAEIEVEGRRLLNFGSNDYLALAADDRLKQAASDAMVAEGIGSGASPLLAGLSRTHEALETALAELEGTESALVVPSGYAANAGTIAALVGSGDVVFTDRKNHASLLDGCRLSRATVRVYPHNDYERLEQLLKRPDGARRRLIVTDTLFSMDGDLAPLEHLADLADRYGSMLLVDEAHATGVFGDRGGGVSESLGVADRIDVRIGTLSKALGCSGGFIVGRKQLIDWLIHRSRPYFFSTAMPAAIAAAALAAVGVVRDEPHRREHLLAQADSMRKVLRDDGWNTGQSASQIIPLIVSQAERALQLSAQLREQGLYVPAIRPPTVPEGEACLRISLTWGHSEDMIGRLVTALKDLRGDKELQD